MHFLKPRLQPMPLKFTGYHRTQVPGSIGLGSYQVNGGKEQDVYVSAQEREDWEKVNADNEPSDIQKRLIPVLLGPVWGQKALQAKNPQKLAEIKSKWSDMMEEARRIFQAEDAEAEKQKRQSKPSASTES